MNITFRKLAMLEQNMIEKEELAKFQGLSTCPIDSNFKERLTTLMDKVRSL